MNRMSVWGISLWMALGVVQVVYAGVKGIAQSESLSELASSAVVIEEGELMKIKLLPTDESRVVNPEYIQEFKIKIRPARKVLRIASVKSR